MLLALAGPAVADDYVYGPAPDWERYKALGEAAVRVQLADPKVRAKLPAASDWSIEWPNGYARLVWFHKGRFPGYTTCGVLRATSPVDDSHRVVNFATVIDRDALKKVQISDKASNSLVNLVCAELVSSGRLPPARLMEGPRERDVAGLGAKITIMPEGAYIASVTASSIGQRAGLVPGMVVIRANGIDLAGTGPTMGAILASDAPELVLETATCERLLVKRAR